jgi:hypothetical protein
MSTEHVSEPPTSPARLVYIDYTNYRGERGIRLIRPIPGGVHFGFNAYHPEPQWLLRAIDVEKNVERTFAMRDIHRFGCPAPAEAAA